ncbi:ribosome silencing factor [Marinimicrobium alkaliphilum]|uniref:ribosome silencing factor n=1 Tax=Marinimicrobium alkaliphilum TaxID=2202654 RepID=UPI000DB95D32|nr:ribosome silencing factor [Marinimicrobium alkaliphilum]
MSPDELNTLITEALDNLKGKEITSLNVRDLSDVMDTMIIASGTSTRHVKSLADNVVQEAKKQGMQPLGSEGIEAGDWVLVDFGDTVVHVMLEETRTFYDLEKLWSTEPAGRSGN